VLPRRSLLKRTAAGERHVTQVLAANVDTALVVCGLDLDFNPRRIERYLAVIEGSGVGAVVVLTKADKDPEAEAKAAELARVLGPEVPVLALNAKDPLSRERLAPWTRPGDTLVLLGSSGAGKSTLTNTLLGIERQRTSEVRESDSRGRHTTVLRSLIQLPGGACIIDTPGMRELKLTGEESLTVGHFREIEVLSHACRFRDCRHQSEPGCAVRAALEAGTLDPERYAHYIKLLAERDHAAQAQVAGARKRVERVANKALSRRLDDKYGSH
jgi:ribosome biogenesis GTPase